MVIMKRFSALLVIAALCTQIIGYQLPNGGKIWALLADICHAYQILHANGIPDENIIVMMYDDIAHNSENPRKGVIINQPDGPNVYKGVLKDYTGETVNSTNFLKILAGDAEAMKGIGSGRVIDSGPNDHVFVNFADHGAPGLIAFPEDELYASDLLSTLTEMAANNRFAKLVMYVEACESGSMFDSLLPDDLNITAADPHESSYACYYDDELQTYLGDVFSVMWMQDTEKEQTRQEKLHHQFEVVRSETNTSHVEEYGDLDLGSLHVSDFMGFRTRGNGVSASNSLLPPMDDVVTSRDVPVAILQRKKDAEQDPKKKQEYLFQIHKMMKYRRHLENIVEEILLLGTGKKETIAEELKHDTYSLKIDDFDCYKKLVSTFSQSCFKISKNPHVLSQLRLFANACGHPEVSEKYVVDAIKKVNNTDYINNSIFMKIYQIKLYIARALSKLPRPTILAVYELHAGFYDSINFAYISFSILLFSLF
ncbi:hypothetical protein C0J52_16851 [Blattella germanica]|nr:hypothetical protein C0J52_16851 [Blattella germanica]